MSCFDCHHNLPTGCALRMPSYETYEPCSKFAQGEYEPGTDKEEEEWKNASHTSK